MADDLRQRNQLMLCAWDSFIRDTPDFMFFKDINLVYLGASRAFAELVGCSRPEDVIGKRDEDLFDKALARRYTQDDRAMLASGRPLDTYIEPLPSKDGRPRFCSTKKSLIRNADGDIVGVYGIGRDVTREYEAKLSYDRQLSSLFELPKNAYVALLLDVTAWRVCEARFGHKGSEVASGCETVMEYQSNAAESVVVDEDVRRFFATLSRSSLQSMYDSGKRYFSMEYLRRMPDGAQRWVRDNAHFLHDPVTSHLLVMFILCDVDDKRRARDKLARAAEQDSLTGLFNHGATMKRISRYLAAEGAEWKHALFMIDIDHFKCINDSFGHQAGDEVITSVASAIKGVFRATDIVGRIGGDEFLVLMKNTADPELVRKKAGDLIEALQYTCGQGDRAVELSGSVGVALYRGDRKPLEELFAEADAALYQAKKAGKNCWAFAGTEVHRSGCAQPDAQPCPIHLKTLLENMDGWVLLCEATEDLRFPYVSPGFFKSREYRPGDEDNPLAAVMPEDLPGLRNAIFESARGKQAMDYTYRALPALGGEAEWRHMRGACLPENGSPARRMLLMVTDVTQLKQAQERLLMTELRRRSAVEQSGVRLWEMDLSTWAFTLPERLGRIAANTPRALAEAFADAESLRPDSVPELTRMFESVRAGDDSGSYAVSLLKENGGFTPAIASFRILRGDNGEPRYATGMLRLPG